MDHNELFLCCRKGDLSRLTYLVEQKEVEINVRDKWDSTPLYYACLCGHYDVAKYLLENGAKCDANTFDGERCLYAALDIEIRNLLQNFKVITSKSLKHDKYDEFLRRCFETGEYHDFTFVVNDEAISVHRCILSARCEYFKERFMTRWRYRKIVQLTNPLVKIEALKALLWYLYTERLAIHFDYLEDCLMIAKHCGLYTLLDEINDAVKKIQFLEDTKPGTCVTTLLMEPSVHSPNLQKDLALLAEETLPPGLGKWVDGSELPFLPDLKQTSFADLCFCVQGYNFLCHKVFFCGRSDYFKALVADHFSEAAHVEGSEIQEITLHNITTEVFIQILYYIYQNSCELTPTTVYDVLSAADMYLLTGLKRQCASFIGQNLDPVNVVNVLKVARMYELHRLEDQCTEFMAKNLEQVISTSDFQCLVLSDAQEVRHRQETDSISVIDDIRYHIGNVQTFSAMQEANEKLVLIDELLERLGLDA